MHCAQIIITALPDIISTLACKSDVNDALLSHVVHWGGLVNSQESACQIWFLCLELLDATCNTTLGVLAPLLCLNLYIKPVQLLEEHKPCPAARSAQLLTQEQTTLALAIAFFSGQHRSVASACIRKGRCRRLLMMSMAFLLSCWPRWTACSHKIGGAGKPQSPKTHSSTASPTELKLDDKPTCASTANSRPAGCEFEQLAVNTMGSASKWFGDGCFVLSMVSCKCATCSLREQTCLLMLSSASVNWGLSGRALHSSSALMTYTKEQYQIKPRFQRFALRFTNTMQPNL